MQQYDFLQKHKSHTKYIRCM